MIKIYAYVLLHRKTNTIVKEGGISFNKKDTMPIKIYRKEYKYKKVLLN